MPAPAGNKNAVGNEGGRPPIYDNPKTLEETCEGYFKWIQGEFHMEKVQIKDKETGRIDEMDSKVWDRYPENPTITGLALFLGFDSRSTIYEYRDKVEFSYVIKRAMLRVENEYEKAVRADKVPTGSIFVLKNMGWSDKQEIDHTTKGDKIQSNSIDYSKLSDAALREIANASRSEESKD